MKVVKDSRDRDSNAHTVPLHLIKAYDFFVLT